jgi:hypothetical protein
MIIGQANGWGRLQDIPPTDDELWLQSAGALVSMREESGLPGEEEASVIALQHGDWLGAVLGLVHGGVGTSAEPDDLARAIATLPDGAALEGVVDEATFGPAARQRSGGAPPG